MNPHDDFDRYDKDVISELQRLREENARLSASLTQARGLMERARAWLNVTEMDTSVCPESRRVLNRALADIDAWLDEGGRDGK